MHIESSAKRMVSLAKKLVDDPILISYLWIEAWRENGYKDVQLSKPPYLTVMPFDFKGHVRFEALPRKCAQGRLVLPLPGRDLIVDAQHVGEIFDQHFSDVETLSALHRFAWVPLFGSSLKSEWVQAIWETWRSRFLNSSDLVAWDAYAASERVINLLDLGRRVGLPGPINETGQILGIHALAIANRLEYFGEKGTYNHLANNGRALYRIGVELYDERWAQIGLQILLKEAERIFLPSGILRESSSHYHLLYTRNYADAWLVALRHKRPEANQFRAIVNRCFAVIPHLSLPGSFPLIGDISPDSPPNYLACFLSPERFSEGWVGNLLSGEQAALRECLCDVTPVSKKTLEADGWLRKDWGFWSALWHTAPLGWCFVPGHAHQDLGSFEIHYKDIPIIIDPGRGAYGEDGEALLYKTGAVHSGIEINEREPYPVNRVYYSDKFRARIAPFSPSIQEKEDVVVLNLNGYYGEKNITNIQREWCFHKNGFLIKDTIKGRGYCKILRRLVIPFKILRYGDKYMFGNNKEQFGFSSRDMTIRTGKRWISYGKWEELSFVELKETVKLPWEGEILVERVECAG